MDQGTAFTLEFQQHQEFVDSSKKCFWRGQHTIPYYVNVFMIAHGTFQISWTVTRQSFKESSQAEFWELQPNKSKVHGAVLITHICASMDLQNHC